MYSNALIFGIAALVLLGLSAVSGFFKGLKGGFFGSLLRLGLTLFSFLAAIPLSRMAVKLFAGLFRNIIASALGQDLFSRILAASPTTDALFDLLTGFVVTPILFILFFFLIWGLTFLPSSLLKKRLLAKKQMPWQIFSAILRAAEGVLVTVALLLPLWGTAGTLHAAVLEMEKTDPAALRDTFEDAYAKASYCDHRLTGSLVENAAANILTNGGDNALYFALTQYDWREEPLSVRHELVTLTSLAMQAGQIKAKSAALTHADAERVRQMADILRNDAFCNSLATEWAVALTDAWSRGETFAGIAVPQVTPLLRPAMNTAFAILSTTTEDAFPDDMVAVSYLLEALSKVKVLGTDDKTMIKALTEGSLTRDLDTVFDLYPRFSGVQQALKNTCMATVFGGDLEKSFIESESFQNVAQNLTESLKEVQSLPTEQKQKAITDKVNKALKENRMEASESVAGSLADEILHYMEETPPDTVQNVIDYFLNITSTWDLSGLFGTFSELLP